LGRATETESGRGCAKRKANDSKNGRRSQKERRMKRNSGKDPKGFGGVVFSSEVCQGGACPTQGQKVKGVLPTHVNGGQRGIKEDREKAAPGSELLKGPKKRDLLSFGVVFDQ